MADLKSAAEAVPEGPVLVCGGAGYIGSHTVDLLVRRDVPVVVLDNLSQGHRAAVPETPRVALEIADLGDADALSRIFDRYRPTAVIHFAALCYVGESVMAPSKYYRENVIKTWELLEAMRRGACRDIVLSSTCATYGEPKTVPIPDEHRQNPINPYGRSKLHMEHMMEDFSAAYGMRYAALRYFNAAGASTHADLGEHHDPETHLIPLVLQVALGQRDEILVYGDDYDTADGTCIRDYVHVEDLAEAHLRGLVVLQQGCRRLACNLGTGRGFSVLQVIEAAREITGHPIPARVVARRPGDPAMLVSGGDRATTKLGFQPQRSELRTMIADAWAFMQRHPHGYRG